MLSKAERGTGTWTQSMSVFRRSSSMSGSCTRRKRSSTPVPTLVGDPLGVDAVRDYPQNRNPAVLPGSLQHTGGRICDLPSVAAPPPVALACTVGELHTAIHPSAVNGV